MKEAMFYERLGTGQVRCNLCRFHCVISDGNRGICNVRENRGGALYSLVYGRICAEQVDPVEKKPLFHLLPGSLSYSIATVGCNFRCHHCQNYGISQLGKGSAIPGESRQPGEIVRRAVESGCRSISYTYTEPTIFYEFAYDTAVLACEAGLKNIFVSNGYITREALSRITPFLHAANIDLKSFNDKFYREIVHASLPELLDSLVTYRELGIWLEITTLVIPGLNDSDKELQGIADFIVSNLGKDTPWHVSRFYPTYRLTDRPPTPVATLRRAREIGLAAGLNYVYEGNVPGSGGESSYCPACSALLIGRSGYRIETDRLVNGACPDCKTGIAGIFS